jgi:hypothetical protein
MARARGRLIKLLTWPYTFHQNEELEGGENHPIWQNNPYIGETADRSKFDSVAMNLLIRESHNFCQSGHIIENALFEYGFKPRRLRGELYLSNEEMRWALCHLSRLPRPIVCLSCHGASAPLPDSPWYMERWL